MMRFVSNRRLSLATLAILTIAAGPAKPPPDAVTCATNEIADSLAASLLGGRLRDKYGASKTDITHDDKGTIHVKVDQLTGSVLEGQIRNLKAAAARPSSISDAQQANGIESRWCFRMTYIQQHPRFGPDWSDRQELIVADKKANEWACEIVGHGNAPTDCKDMIPE